MFFFKYRLNNFFQISYKWYSMEPHILVSIMDGFFLLLVYSVKKIDSCGEIVKKTIYLTWYFKKWRGGKTEINPSSRNKQICRHSCRKSRLYVCQRDTTPSLYLPSHFSLSLSISVTSVSERLQGYGQLPYFFPGKNFHYHKFKVN